MHSLMLQIPADKFEDLNRRATEGNFASIEAYLLHLALGGEPIEEPERGRKPKMQTQSIVEPRRG